MKFQVEGMSCAHCVRAVTEALRGVDPAARVEVDLSAKRVQVEGALDSQQAIRAIGEAGYEATPLP